MNKIRIAIIGVGNCASSLIQGIHYYKGKNLENAIGLMHGEIAGYRPEDIRVVACFDKGCSRLQRAFSIKVSRLFRSDRQIIQQDFRARLF